MGFKEKYSWTIFIVLFFLAAALFVSWPLMTNLDHFILPKAYNNISHSDTLQHISKINETRQQGDIMVDSTDVSQLYILLGLAFTSIGMGAIVFHNLFFMAVIFLAGLFMYLFAYELTKSRYASLIAGLVYSCSTYIPYAYYWGHSNTMQIEWIPLIFYLIEKLVRESNLKNSIWLGVALSLQVLSGSQTTIYLTFMIPIYMILRCIFDKTFFGSFRKLKIKHLLLMFTTTLVLTSYYLYKKIMAPTMIRTIEENMQDYWRVTSLNQFIDYKGYLFLGFVQIGLLIFALYLLIKKYERYKRYISFLALFLFALLCTFGPFSIFAPYYWLYYWWPLVDHFRVAFRIFPFVLLGLGILCSLFISYIEKSRFKRYVNYVTFAIIVLLVIQAFFSPWLSNLHFS